jgi:DUF2975 family protein
MKSKLLITDYLLLAAIVFIILTKFISYDPGISESPLIISDELTHSIDPSDSFTYSRYKQVEDSLQLIRNCQKIKLQANGSGITYIFPSFLKITESDSCLSPISPNYVTTDKNYLVLPEYRLRLNAVFAIERGKYFLKTAGNEGQLNSTEIGVRYQPPRQSTLSNDREPGKLLIPISSNAFSIVKMITYTLAILMAIYALWIIFILPLKILYSIATGTMFSPHTRWQMRMIGWSLVIFSLLRVMSVYLFHSIYQSMIPPEFFVSFRGLYFAVSDMLLAGLIVLLVGSAFKKGYEYKRDGERLREGK